MIVMKTTTKAIKTRTAKIPDDLHQTCKVQAARKGMQFQEFIAAMLKQALKKRIYNDFEPDGTEVQ
jgi:predicted DNA binding CopG/RHH family protein